jgi:hypothetical protein
MKLTTQDLEIRRIKSFLRVMEVLTQLGWLKNESSYLLLDDWPKGFAQVCQWRKGKYLVEWRSKFNPAKPDHGLVRAQRSPNPGKVLLKGRPGTGYYPIHENDLLEFTDAVAILLAFWQGHPRPRQFKWRDMTELLKASHAQS